MHPQLFTDSLVAVNITLSLALWAQLSAWTWRSGNLPLQKRQVLACLSCFFPLMLVISLSHASWSTGAGWLQPVEVLLALLIGPLVFNLVLGRYYRVGRFTLALPVALLAGAAAWQVSPALTVFVPVLFSAATLWLYLTHRERRDRLIFHVLSIALVIHLSQLCRFLAREISWLQEIVPFSAALLGLFYTTWLLMPASRRIPATVALERDPVFEAVDEHMRVQRAFRDPDLTLGRLAAALGLPAYLVSRAINSHAGRFNDYVNSYRVREFLASDRGHGSIEGLAHRCGFNSRSAFYRAFRQATGKTPSQYRHDCRPDLQTGT